MNSFKDHLAEKQRLDPKCWDGYKKKGTKMKGDTKVNNCVKEGDQHSWKSEGHYTKDGKEWKGPQHAHDGQVMTGEKHTADSQDLYHYKELSADIRKKISKTIEEGGIKSGHKRPTEDGAGLTQKGVDAENRKTGGNLQTAVTTPPSKLKKDSKAAGRRKSFCARSKKWDGERGKAARARWNC